MRNELIWKLDGKVHNVEEICDEIEKIRKTGATAALLVGAEDATKAAVISEIWNRCDKVVTPQIYCELNSDIARGFLIIDNLPGLEAALYENRAQWLQIVSDAGAKQLVMIWVKCSNEIDRYNNISLMLDRLLRDNPPINDPGYSFFIEVEVQEKQ